MPGVRFPHPHLPVDVRFSEAYLRPGAPPHLSRRITVDDGLRARCWTSPDGMAWTRGDGNWTVTWGEDGSLTVEFL